MSKLIAFATDTQWPQLTPDDQLAQVAAKAIGIEVQPAIWHDPAVDWTHYAAVILRSTWDYHIRPAEFAAWLVKLEELQMPVWNPIDVVRWNMNKRYLAELESKGVRIVPSVWISQGEKPDFKQISNGWEHQVLKRLVLKPLVSADSYNTWVIETEADWQEKLAVIHRESDAVAQPFLREVQDPGEWSLVFFDGEFSHAALKTPKAGDFRTQKNHGGTTQPASPDPDLIAQARQVLESVDKPLLYARVDGVVSNGLFYLMELELIEPLLFMQYAPGSAERFAAAIHKRIGEVA